MGNFPFSGVPFLGVPWKYPWTFEESFEESPNEDTLQGTNISHLGNRKIIFNMPFLGDMLVPWRLVVSSFHQTAKGFHLDWAQPRFCGRSCGLAFGIPWHFLFGVPICPCLAWWHGSWFPTFIYWLIPTLTIYSWIGKYSSFYGSYGFLSVKQSLNPIGENMKFR